MTRHAALLTMSQVSVCQRRRLITNPTYIAVSPVNKMQAHAPFIDDRLLGLPVRTDPAASAARKRNNPSNLGFGNSRMFSISRIVQPAAATS